MSSQQIPRHPLGKNGPAVPALGFGLMMLTSSSYGSLPNDEERFAVLDRAVELGETFWDTSDLYGDNEVLLKKWFQQTGKRDQIFLASKFGYVKKSPTFEIDSSAEYCKKACEETLQNLGVHYIDLYYAHNVNTNTPIEETMRALAELQSEGKIKHIGLSMISSNTLRRAVKIAPVAACQAEYSLFSREVEGSAGCDLLATCRELGVAFVAATPLGRGLLTPTFSKGDPVGDSSDMRAQIMPRFVGENRDHNVKTAQLVENWAQTKGCSVAQLGLAWLLKQGDDVFPIPGTRRTKYLEDNCGSVGVSLSDNEEAEIRGIVEKAGIVGGAVPDRFAGLLFRDTVEE
ncbi:uncharacterized protein N7459_008996 [Penicillium hispanicum]|uniref:uncharacterized protein n=1 Tax=Penicillium hispanicum TaxID=1080232 RepID=UPI0025403A4D|nr:uncharacterized protein N7459_008996 [Penicillium hispanicum]KAJ5569566.1 hypothetical protein N7459_008996 [Penicillium hispanicum]